MRILYVLLAVASIVGWASDEATIGISLNGSLEQFKGDAVVCIIAGNGNVSGQAAEYLVKGLQARGVVASRGCEGVKSYVRVELSAADQHCTSHGVVNGRFELTVTAYRALSSCVLIRPNGAYLKAEANVLAPEIAHLIASGAFGRTVAPVKPARGGV